MIMFYILLVYLFLSYCF